MTTATMTTTVSSSCEKVYDLVLFGVTGFTGKLAAEYLLRHYYNSANTTSCDTDDATKDKDAVTITDHKPKLPVLSWAVCARNESKAREILETLIQQIVEDDEGTERTTMTKNDITKSDNITASTSTATATKTTTNTTTTVRQHRMVPPIVVADLQCTTTEQRVQLDRIVQQTKVVITCAGPFELYGPALVQACVTQGVHYADITGESDFFRQMIQQYDDRARQNHAAILCHCGADCIPQTVMVYEMHRFCQQRYGSVNDPASMIPQLYQVVNYIEWSQSTRMSGGTAATAVYQLGKPRPPKKKKNNNNNTNKEAEGKDNDKSDDSNDYDPLLKRPDGTKSPYTTLNISPKQKTTVPELGGKQVGPWIMGPVMVNAVRRSNAILQYCPDFQYADGMIHNIDDNASLLDKLFGGGFLSDTLRVGAALILPTFLGKYIIPQPGEGPDRATMERGYAILHSRGLVRFPNDDQVKEIRGTFHFHKDISYLYTAALLVETGILLTQYDGEGGVVTPEVALGHALTERILERLDVTLTIEEVSH